MNVTMRWSEEAAGIMESITNKVAIDAVIKIVERYCMDKGVKEVDPESIYNAKPELKYLFSIPFNLNYERHYGPVYAM